MKKGLLKRYNVHLFCILQHRYKEMLRFYRESVTQMCVVKLICSFALVKLFMNLQTNKGIEGERQEEQAEAMLSQVERTRCVLRAVYLKSKACFEGDL